MKKIYDMTVAEKLKAAENLWIWREAILSGKYPKSEYGLQLRDDEGFDCFGIACDLFKNEDESWLRRGPRDWSFVSEGKNFCFYAPKRILVELGMSREDERRL